jgi:class 3 adenylate cyclase
MSLEGLGGHSPEIRASDAEREYVVDVLRAHCSEGRIDLDEFSERINRVYAARTIGELNDITNDLPVPMPASDVTARGEEQVGRVRKAVRWTIGIMSGPARRGRWRIEGETNALAFMGGVTLDLRDAEIQGDEITVRCYAFMGGIEIIVSEGVEVHMSGIPFMGGFDNKIADVPVLPGTPIVKVTGFAFMGGVDVKSKASPAEEQKRKEDRRRARQERREAMRSSHTARHDARRDVHEAIQQAKLEAIQQAREATKRALASIPDWLPAPPAPPAPSAPPAPPAGRPTPAATRPTTGRTTAGHGNAAPEGTVTLLVTDIEGSTEMTEDLGDIRWVRKLNRHNEQVRECVADHSGIELKNQGDGFLLAFPSARKALLCAVSLQKSFHEDDLPVRMGLHTGEVIREGDDLYGRNVILASRICGEARGGEILVSSLTKELCDSSGDLSFSDDREVALKGLNGTFRVWSLDWK